MIPSHSSNRSPSSNGHSCRIVATATAVPPFTITREDVKTYLGRTFNINERRVLYDILRAHAPGDSISLKVLRNNRVFQIEVPATRAEDYFA